jgi:very-short-patch-repair endonuclease
VGGGRGRGTKMKNSLSNVAKNLRKQATDTELSLWLHLQAKQLEGFKFRRQEPIGKYIVDFVCFEKKIIVEVDGGQHSGSDNDKNRDEWLTKQGFKVLRFWNNEVLTNMTGVLEVIRSHCLLHPPLTPPIKGGDIL